MAETLRRISSLAVALSLLITSPGGAYAAAAAALAPRTGSAPVSGAAGASRLTGAAPSLRIPAGLSAPLAAPTASPTPTAAPAARPALSPAKAEAPGLPVPVAAALPAAAPAPAAARPSFNKAIAAPRPANKARAGARGALSGLAGRVARAPAAAAPLNRFFDRFSRRSAAGAPVRGASGRPSRPGLKASAAGSDAASQAKDMLGGDKKQELVLPDFYWGGLDLAKLAKAPTELSPERRLWIEAYKAIIRHGLRPKGSPADGMDTRTVPPEALAAAQAVAAADPMVTVYDAWWKALDTVAADLGAATLNFNEPVLDSLEIDETNDIPAAVLQRAVDLGLHRLKFPKEHGGLGLDQREYVEILETIAFYSPSLTGQVSAHNTIGTAPLTMFGTPEQQARYLPRLTRGDEMVSFGLTEPKAGTDIDKMETTAVLSADGKSWRLTGSKVFITGITDAGVLYLVAGHTIVDGEDVGPTVFIVDDMGFKVNESWDDKKRNLLKLEKRGMRITPWTRDGLEMMMIKGTDQGFIELDGFEVPADRVLGPVGRDAATRMDGKKVPLRSLNKGRAGFAYLNEAARWFADRELQWSVDRLMFDMYSPEKGEPGRQAYMERTQTLLGRSRIKAAALKVLSKYSSALIDVHPEAGVAALSALIKVRMSDWAWENALETLDLGGGPALTKGAPGRVYQTVLDIWITRIVEGVNPAMAQFPHMMAGGKVMNSMLPLGMFRVAWNQAVNWVLPFFSTSRGALSRAEAKWVQRRSAAFSRRFMRTATLLGIKGFIRFIWTTRKFHKLLNPIAVFKGVMKSSQIEFSKRQNTLIRAFEAQADILMLAMIQTELRQNGKALETTEREALQAAVKILTSRIDEALRHVNTQGHPIENIERDLGLRLVQEELKRRAEDPQARPNRVEEYGDFLRAFADEFYGRLHEEAREKGWERSERPWTHPTPDPKAETAPPANLKRLKEDIARRVEQAPGPVQGPRKRIAVVAAKRLPQGKFPSSFMRRDSAKALGARLVGGLLDSAGLAASEVEALAAGGDRVKIVFGAVDSSESPNIAREIAVEAGLPTIPGTGLCKNCGTSLEAAAMGMSMILSGEADVVIAGGAESMSRLPMIGRDPKLVRQAMTLAVLPDMIRKAGPAKKPVLLGVYLWTWLAHKWRRLWTRLPHAILEGLAIDGVMMAHTAQTLADKYGVDREEQDWLAYESQTRAANAAARGEFADEIVPYVDGKGNVHSVDQGIRFGQSRKGFRKLPRVFGTKDITAGNASQISDGSSGVVLMSEEKARELGLVPLAWLTAVSDTGVNPQEMGIGPAYAIPMALKRVGKAAKDAVVELNEAFAAQEGAVRKALGLDPDKVNPLGGAIALGHPLAASGTRLMTTLIHYMMRHGEHLGVCSLCIGGGEGIAAVVERDVNGISAEFKAAVREGLKAKGVSAAVRDRVERTLNGLPPATGADGAVYPSVWRFLHGLVDRAPDAREHLPPATEGRVLELPERPAFGAGFDAVLDAVDRDIRVFGEPKGEYRTLKISIAEGVATVALSRPPVNAINRDVVEDLDRVMDALAADPAVKSVVFIGEGDKFMAGADISLLAKAEDPVEAAGMAASLQAVFNKIEASQKPVVMALNGQALGGGSEMAISGHERIAAGTAELGQPEVKLLFNPGAGGTQRLPRLVGLTHALTAMNSGQTYDAHTAKSMGWVDAVVEPGRLLASAQARARELADMDDAARTEWVRKRRTLGRRVKLTLLERIGMLFNGFMIRRLVRKQTLRLGEEKAIAIPAMMRIIDATLEGVRRGPRAGLKLEHEIFGRLAVGPASKLIQRIFVSSSNSAKGVTAKPLPIKSVGVAGAGTMGAGVAQLSAYSGFPVVLKDINQAALDRGMGHVRGLFDKLVEKDLWSPKQAQEAMGRVSGVLDDAAFAEAAPTLLVDNILVPGKSYEENVEFKTGLVKRWGETFPPETIFTINTSAHPITEMAWASGRPEKFVGLHFFNPVHKMKLVELILPKTDGFTPEQLAELEVTVATVREYLKKMGRVVIEVQDRPGFIDNTLLVQGLNPAMRMLEEGASIEQLDRVMKRFGMPMGVLELTDFVGFYLAEEVGAYLPTKLAHMGQMSLVVPFLMRWGHTGNARGEANGFFVKGRPNDEAVSAAAGAALVLKAEAAALREGWSALADLDNRLKALERSFEEKGRDALAGSLVRAHGRVSALADALQERARAPELGDAMAQRLETIAASLKAGLDDLVSMTAGLEDPAGLAPVRAALTALQETASFKDEEFQALALALRRAAARRHSDQEIEERVVLAMFNEAARMLEEGAVASADDIDIAMLTGTGFPIQTGGLMRHVSAQGLDYVVERLRRYAEEGGGPAFEPADILVRLAQEGRGLYDQEK